MEREELLRCAARCYQQAERFDDACRCFELAGDDASAGQLHARAGRHERAIAAWERVPLWREAAESYLHLGQPRQAAACLVRAEQPLRAAWVYADQAGEPGRAQDLLRSLEAVGPAGRWQVKVVEARCDAEFASRRRLAMRKVQEVVGVLETGVEAIFIYSIDLRAWTHATAAALGRPDLEARLHAAAWRAEVPGALRQWERWAFEKFGSAEGLPRDNEIAAEEDP